MLDPLLRFAGAYRIYERRLKSEVKRNEVPSHIGIILDGNRRWAANQGMSLELGHEEGANKAEDLLDWCHELRIKSVTLYVLSTENLDRSPAEVSELLRLIESRLQKLLTDERIYRYEVRVKAIGKLEFLTPSIRELFREIEARTAGFSQHYLNIAIAYGGRTEITDVVRSIAEDVRKGRLAPEEITQDTISKRLYTSYMPNPEPDLIIRTSGEERMSGFMLWQGAYSELVFMDVFWPAFRYIDLLRAIRTYQRRTRKHGR